MTESIPSSPDTGSAQKTALITGAAGNLGTALAHKLAGEGIALALLDVDASALDRVRTQLPNDLSVQTFSVNLIDPDSVAETVQAVVDRFGRIDLLANIAGGFRMGSRIDETADADWNLMMDLNTRSVFNVCRSVLPIMRAASFGRIVNISARAALGGVATMGPYCASKAAVITLTESLAQENKDLGINVNCILPGTIDTPQNRAAMPDADVNTWVPTSALADVIAFLMSDAATCVTGAAIPVYGRG